MSTPSIERMHGTARQPRVLYADAGYPTPQSLLDARVMDCDLRAPVIDRGVCSPEMRRNKWDMTDDGKVKHCPGRISPTRHATVRQSGCKKKELHAFFDGAKCLTCPFLEDCPSRGNKKSPSSERRLNIDERYLAHDEALTRQETEGWNEDYAVRAGIEATNSELKRVHSLGRTRVRGYSRMLMRSSLALTACNAKRWGRHMLNPPQLTELQPE